MLVHDVPEEDRVFREDVLAYLTTRYEHASSVLRDAQWEAFRSFVQIWLEIVDWRTPEGLARYMALAHEHRRQRSDRFSRQADSWDVTLNFPVQSRDTSQEERASWRREFSRARERFETRFAQQAAKWEAVKQFLEAEHELRHMPVELRDAYGFLGLPPRATLADARRRYREMAKKLHPDVSGTTADMARLNDAWDRIVRFFIS